MAHLVLKAETAVRRFLSAQLPFLYAALRFCYQAPFILGSKAGGSPRDTPARVPGPDALFAAEGRTP